MIPKLVLIPLIVGLLAQASKFISLAAIGRFDWKVVNVYGGMPSAHTAITVSLLTVIGLEDGITSAGFAISLIFAIIVIRDAIGFRQYLGSHSRALNLLVRDLPERERPQFTHYREQLGHTPLEAFVGGVLGFCLSALFYLVIP